MVQARCPINPKVPLRRPLLPRVAPSCHSIDELGAELAADAPGQPAFARIVRREDDVELRRDVQELGDNLDTASRDIRDRAVTRQRARSPMDLRNPPAQTAFA